MKNKKRIATIIRWTARIWGSLNLAFLVFMVGAHIISALFVPEEAGEFDFDSTTEMITFLFFPVSTLIGLSIAWKWDGLGGMITIGGIIGLFILRPDLITSLEIIGLAAPGLLFLTYWLLSRGKNKQFEK